MSKDNVLALRNPGIAGEVPDVLTHLLRDGAQQMLARAIEAEVAEFLERYRLDMDQAGRARMVRNGYMPERTIQTGLGEVGIKAPRVRDRASKIRFTSAILPPYFFDSFECFHQRAENVRFCLRTRDSRIACGFLQCAANVAHCRGMQTRTQNRQLWLAMRVLEQRPAAR